MVLRGIPVRFWVGLMVFYTTFTHYTFKVNINVLLRYMVSVSKQKFTSCYLNDTSTCQTYQDPRYDWSSAVQDQIVTAYFYPFMFTSLVGGWLAEWVGPFNVIFWVHLVNAAVNATTPYAAQLHFTLVMAVRGALGLLAGLVFPSVHCLIARWSPPEEKGRFLAGTMGTMLAVCVTWPTVTYVAETYGWTWGYNVVSIHGVVFCIFFFLFGSDSPTTHFMMDRQELYYIRRAIDNTVTETKVVPPYHKILRSKPFWILVIGLVGYEWGLEFQVADVTQLMIDMVPAQHYVQTLIVIAPFFVRLVYGMFVSILSDYLIIKGYPHIFIRRFFGISSHLLAGFLMLLGYCTGARWRSTVTLLTLSMGFSGAVTTTTHRTPHDMAPNFAGTIYGTARFFSSMTGFMVPPITTALVDPQNDMDRWRWVFMISGLLMLLTGIIYISFITTQLQQWNEKRNDRIIGLSSFSSGTSRVSFLD